MMFNKSLFFLVTGLLMTSHVFGANAPIKLVVTVPVADLRDGPGAAPDGVVPPALSQDLLTPGTKIGQDSQALMNEWLLKIDDPSVPAGWLKVEAIQQPGLVDGQWQGGVAYIQANQVKQVSRFPAFNAVVRSLWANVVRHPSDKQATEKLSLGTCVWAEPWGSYSIDGQPEQYSSVELASGKKGLIKDSNLYVVHANVQEDLEELRSSIVDLESKLENIFYYWGGCSADKIDCSANVYLVLRAHGLLIPRNAHPQFLKAAEVAAGTDLKPGDGVYFRNTDGKRMNHELMLMEEEKLVETTGRGFSSKTQTKYPETLNTCYVASKDYFGCPVAQLANDREFVLPSGPKVMYLRTFFGSDQQVQQLRDAFLNPLKIYKW